jgi:hypothetical protein
MSEMLLLGAGASIEAGVPGAYAMTQRIIEAVEADPFHRRHAHLLRFVVGGLLFQRGVRGEDPFGGVNVEDLFSAIQLLGSRQDLEAAPFVGSWHPMVEEFDRTQPERTDARPLQRRLREGVAEALLRALPSQAPMSDGRDVDKALDQRLKKVMESIEKKRSAALTSSESVGRSVSEHVLRTLKGTFTKMKQQSQSTPSDAQLGKALGVAVDKRRPRPAGGRLFRAVNELMVQLLADIVWIEEADRVGYLSPFLRLLNPQPSLVVATLNYDNGVERLCEARGVPCSTGIDEWSHTGDFVEASGVTLLKLHGSIDWRLLEDQRTPQHPMPHSRIARVDMTAQPRQSFHPALIFGQRNKLTAEGPFLDLLRAFRNALAVTERLTVVGYSFRDSHINEYVTQWLNGNDKRRLQIIDPAFTTNTSLYAQQLQRAALDRLDIVHEVASVGLTKAYGSY